MAPKKFRLARRVCYFVCGHPGDPYAVSQRPACRLMTLPLTKNGRPGPELQQLIEEVRAEDARGLNCTYFFDVMEIYDARNTLGHGGRLGLSATQADQATWFIPSILLRPLFSWFAEHPDAELAELDTEIDSLPRMTA